MKIAIIGAGALLKTALIASNSMFVGGTTRKNTKKDKPVFNNYSKIDDAKTIDLDAIYEAKAYERAKINRKRKLEKRLKNIEKSKKGVNNGN